MSKGLSASRHAPMTGTSRTFHPPPRPSPSPSTLPVPTGTEFSPSNPSTWAPTTPTASPPASAQEKHATYTRARHELTRCQRMMTRMEWKIELLDLAYRKAQQVTTQADRSPWAASAQTMFKLDYFEFYMLLERALVHLLAVYGVEIHRGAGFVGAENKSHRYHSNVLAALAGNGELRRTLGRPEVLAQLRRAKNLRNRWKNADEDEDAADQAPTHNVSVQQQPMMAQSRHAEIALDDYNLADIFAVIPGGVGRAFEDAQRHVEALRADAEQSGAGVHGEDDFSMEEDVEEQWGFMFDAIDAMDWESV